MKFDDITFGEIANGDHFGYINNLIDYCILLKSIKDVEIEFDRQFASNFYVFRIFKDKEYNHFKLYITSIKYLGLYSLPYEYIDIPVGNIMPIFEVHSIKDELWRETKNKFIKKLVSTFNQNRCEFMQRLK